MADRAPSGPQTRTVETREVLAAAYLGPNKGRTMLTHAVVVINGQDADVLCRRVSFLSLAGRNAGNDIHAEPTCAECRRKVKAHGR